MQFIISTGKTLQHVVLSKKYRLALAQNYKLPRIWILPLIRPGSGDNYADTGNSPSLANLLESFSFKDINKVIQLRFHLFWGPE